MSEIGWTAIFRHTRFDNVNYARKSPMNDNFSSKNPPEMMEH